MSREQSARLYRKKFTEIEVKSGDKRVVVRVRSREVERLDLVVVMVV